MFKHLKTLLQRKKKLIIIIVSDTHSLVLHKWGVINSLIKKYGTVTNIGFLADGNNRNMSVILTHMLSTTAGCTQPTGMSTNPLTQFCVEYYSRLHSTHWDEYKPTNSVMSSK